MSHYKRYPAYKDSEVEWIAEVPEHWNISRIAQLGRLSKANGGNKQDEKEIGVPCVRYGDLYTTHTHFVRESRSCVEPETAAEYTPIEYGDALFAASGETLEEIGKSAVNLMIEKACCGGDLIVLRPAKTIDPIFLGYALDCSMAVAQKATMGRGFTVVHIYTDQVKNLTLAFPPLQEQQLIGFSLDRETARIDALIAKKTRFIELLKEKRQALITKAVTKGLDPNVQMKDSGVEWIGKVPGHWEIARVKHVSRKESGHTPDKKNPDFWEDCRIPWVSLKDSETLRNVDYIYDTYTYINELGLQGSSARILPEGTVVFTRDATVGLCAITQRPMAVSQHLVGWVHTGQVDPEYLLRVFEAMAVWLDSLTAGATIKTIGMDDIGVLSTPLPPPSEQLAIAKYLQARKSSFARLIERTQHSIDLLKERRAALITAAVTGQIDLRDTS